MQVNIAVYIGVGFGALLFSYLLNVFFNTGFKNVLFLSEKILRIPYNFYWFKLLKGKSNE